MFEGEQADSVELALEGPLRPGEPFLSKRGCHRLHPLGERSRHRRYVSVDGRTNARTRLLSRPRSNSVAHAALMATDLDEAELGSRLALTARRVSSATRSAL